MASSRRRKDCFTSFLFVLPLLTLFLVFFAYPIIYNIVISFYDWNGISVEKVFVGFANYKNCLLYTSPSPRDYAASRMPSSA